MEDRLQVVLDYLLENGETGIRQLGIMCGYTVQEDKTNHDCCAVLRRDIERINNSNEHNYTIIYDKDYNYRIAKDKNEAIEFYEKKKLYPALKKLKAYWITIGKIKENGQIAFDEEMKQFIIKAFQEV